MAKGKEDYDYLFKIILVGDPKVGKTSFQLRYTKGVNPKKPPPTIGVEYATKPVLLKGGEGIVKAQIWDTSGSEKYKSIATAHYRKSAGALLFYDLTNYESFNNMKGWLKEIQENTQEEIIIMLIGNKIDLVNENQSARKVKIQEAQQFAKENNLLYEETSAKNGQNVNQSFEKLIQHIYDYTGVKDQNNNNMNNGFQLNNGQEVYQQDEGCCGGSCQPKK